MGGSNIVIEDLEVEDKTEFTLPEHMNIVVLAGIEGVRYDMRGESYVDIVAYRDYKRSYSDYETYEEACEAGIRYCLENLI